MLKDHVPNRPIYLLASLKFRLTEKQLANNQAKSNPYLPDINLKKGIVLESLSPPAI
jgi:hypothetical protein